MLTPFFSVIIPTLNEEKYIGQLLDSLVKQTEKDFEVVVVDHQSQDRTREVANNFQKQLRLHLTSSLAANVAGSRNIGARQAQGMYLVFLDADVTVPTNYMETLRQQIRKTNLDFASVRTAHRLLHPFEYLLAWPFAFARYLSVFLGKPYFSGENIIIKRSVFLVIEGFDEGFALGEDVELVQRAALKKFKGIFLFNPWYWGSVRRFEKEGRTKILFYYTKVFFHFILFGHRRKLKQAYKMGGQDE